MDACRQLAMKSGKKPPEPAVLAFHEEFLNEVKRNGRVHEISLTAFYKLRTKQFLADVFQGIQMFLVGAAAEPDQGSQRGQKAFQGLEIGGPSRADCLPRLTASQFTYGPGLRACSARGWRPRT
jgi:hypothetical protein